ncbi:MAG: glyoxylate/hydroxypyruvate reductase A, partial [Alphaproteobacteria bacterium]|nr:glyoxylate/hydroxypyruvate reductase A [Alphaproteobacteria bacterium]
AIFITPHSAGLTNITAAASQLHKNYLNMKNNRPLLNPVDPVLGY